MTCRGCEQVRGLIVTKQGPASLAGLAPRERARLIIENCALPAYCDILRDDYRGALKFGGQTLHPPQRAFEMHVRMKETGSMLPAGAKK